jgi:hypothetical protein
MYGAMRCGSATGIPNTRAFARSARGDPEVRDEGTAGGILVEDVGRFDVAVDDALLVRGREPISRTRRRLGASAARSRSSRLSETAVVTQRRYAW